MRDEVASYVFEILEHLSDTRPTGVLKGRTTREDILQDSYVRVLSRGDVFEGRVPREVRRFLARVVTSVRIDESRRLGRAERDVRRERPLESIGEEPAADLTTPSRKCSRAETRERLLAALAELPPDQRRAVELRYLEGGSLLYVAEEMGKSTHAVAGLLRRGLKVLRVRLVPMEGI